MANIYSFWQKMEIITERVSSLEWFANCPKKYNEIAFDGTNAKTIIATGMWDILHGAHQNPWLALVLANIFSTQTVPILLGKKDNFIKIQLETMINLACGWIEEFKDYEKYFETKNSMVIAWVYVTGSYDCLIIDKDGSYRMFDYKSAGNINYYANREEKWQPLIYAYFVMVQFNVDRIKFSYEIYVKGKDNGKVTVVRKTKILYRYKHNEINQEDYIDNVEEKVTRLVRNYRLAKESDFFVPNRRTPSWEQVWCCYYCPLRTLEDAEKIGKPQCELWEWWVTLDIDSLQEIEF